MGVEHREEEGFVEVRDDNSYTCNTMLILT